MTRKILIAVCLLSSIGAHAQLYTLKAGANYNADVVDHKLGKLSYPSYEINFERALGKKFSISLGYNFAIRDYKQAPDLRFDRYSFSGNVEWKHYDHVFIPEVRYYLKSNTEGFFFQLGFPLTYSLEKDYFYSPTGITNYYTHSSSLSVFGGIGIRYQLCSKVGVEMTMNISPSADLFGDVDYGTSGFIKSGIRFFYTFRKSKSFSEK